MLAFTTLIDSFRPVVNVEILAKFMSGLFVLAPVVRAGTLEVTDVTDVLEAPDAPDALEAPDALDAPDAPDALDAPDISSIYI
jgi:hypothetical protein